MISLNIDTESKIAVYRQLVDEITSAVRDGRLKAGDIIPSMNELSDELGISKETVKRAYGILREKAVLEAHQGKGFYVADSSKKDSVSVLFLLDKFSTYKQETISGFHEESKVKTEDTILLFNQDVRLFEYFLNENLGKYDYYVVSPHFPRDKETQLKVTKLIRRIPNHKLIMIDRWMPEIPGNYGAIYQDFDNDAYNGLTQGVEKFNDVSMLKVITLPSSLYGPVMERSIRKFCKDNSLRVKFLPGVPKDICKGDVFLILNSQLDSGLLSLWENAGKAGLKVGEDYFIISYNDSPIDKMVLGGLTTISTDFKEMGREAARMINEKTMWKTHIKFKMNKRSTF